MIEGIKATTSARTFLWCFLSYAAPVPQPGQSRTGDEASKQICLNLLDACHFSGPAYNDEHLVRMSWHWALL